MNIKTTMRYYVIPVMNGHYQKCLQAIKYWRGYGEKGTTFIAFGMSICTATKENSMEVL